MKEFYFLLIRMFILSVVVVGCAAILASTPKQPTNLSEIGIGSTQTEIEQRLGLCAKTLLLPMGKKINYYRFTEGVKPNISRAAIHATLTYATVGLWEMAGVPFEERNNTDKYLAVTYNETGIAIDIQVMDIPAKY